MPPYPLPSRHSLRKWSLRTIPSSLPTVLQASLKMHKRSLPPSVLLIVCRHGSLSNIVNCSSIYSAIQILAVINKALRAFCLPVIYYTLVSPEPLRMPVLASMMSQGLPQFPQPVSELNSSDDYDLSISDFCAIRQPQIRVQMPESASPIQQHSHPINMQKASPYAYLARKAAPQKEMYVAPEIVERDLNIFVVSFDKAKEAQKNIGAGDPVLCAECKVCLNKHSKILTKAEYDSQEVPKELPKELSIIAEEVEKPKNPSEVLKEEEVAVKSVPKRLELSPKDMVWICEFCQHHNRIRVEKEEIPTLEDLVYIVQSASNKVLKESDNDSTIVFCIDNSGSMNTSHEVKGKVNLKHGVSAAEIEFLKQFMEPGDEAQLNYIPGQAHGITYVSRKQCVMAAIESQLDEMKSKDPNKKVGLITFNNEVVVYGDCKKEPLHILGDRLNKFNEIVAGMAPVKVEEPLRNSYEQLLHNFNKIEASGATALGPAVLSAIELASKGAPGSTVMICTDGLANIGLGNLDMAGQETKQFYAELAFKAKASNLNVNVVTIKGEACNVSALAGLARETNGNVLVVNPEDITKKFANILKDEMVGLNMTVQVRLPRCMRFRNVLPEHLKQNGLLLEKEIGNATVNTKVSFEYELRDDEELQKLGIDPTKLKSLPFQAQVMYTSLSGHRLLRVITSTCETTTNKAIIEKIVEVPVVHARIAQRTAELEKVVPQSKMLHYNDQMMEYVERNLAKEEHQRAENKRFTAVNTKVKAAYKNKESRQSKPMEKQSVKKEEMAEMDAQEDVMLRFEQGKNLYEQEQ